MSSLRALLAALALLLALPACWPAAPARAEDGPFSTTHRGRATYERAITRGRARDVLGQLDPEARAWLDETMFIADLQMASGNEQNPLRIYRRVQRELAEPRVVSHESVATVLADMRRVLDDHPGVPSGEYDPVGYEVVTEMLASAQGAFPSTGACLDHIASQPDQLAVAFLVQEYFADDHYHAYLMKQQIFELLITGGFGPMPLVVIEEQLRDSYAYHSADSEWSRAVAAGRTIVGDDFDAWYREVRGSSYAWEWLGAFF